MPIAIRETIVTPASGGDVIQLHISDAPLGDEYAKFAVRILAKLPPVQTSAVAQLQREVIEIAQAELSQLLQDLAMEIQNAGLDLQTRRPE